MLTQNDTRPEEYAGKVTILVDYRKRRVNLNDALSEKARDFCIPRTFAARVHRAINAIVENFNKDPKYKSYPPIRQVVLTGSLSKDVNREHLRKLLDKQKVTFIAGDSIDRAPLYGCLKYVGKPVKWELETE